MLAVKSDTHSEEALCNELVNSVPITPEVALVQRFLWFRHTEGNPESP